MPVRRRAPYRSVVLQAVLGFAQARNPSIKGVISNNGHTLILYNVSENDIDLIEIPTPDGKSHQNVHFISINPYFETESVNNPIRVYGLDGMVHQTYRQEEANAYRNLTTQATFLPFSKLGIPSLTDNLSDIGSSVGVAEKTRGKKKLYCIKFGNGQLKVITQPAQPLYPPSTGWEGFVSDVDDGMSDLDSDIDGGVNTVVNGEVESGEVVYNIAYNTSSPIYGDFYAL